MSDEKNKKIRVRAYNNAWSIENKIYAIANIKLPVPVSLIETSYFALIIIIMLILGVVIPPIKALPTIVKFIIIPFGMTKFLLKKKLDGKSPQKYLVGYLKYLFVKNDYIERFGIVSKHKDKKIKITWQCSRGNSKMLFPLQKK